MMSGILASIGSDNGLSSFWSKPLPKPMLTYHPFHPCKKLVKLKSRNDNLHVRYCIWKCPLQNVGHFCGGCLNLKMSYQYRDSHYKDKMFSWPAYLYNGNPLTWKDCLYNKMGPWPQCVKNLYFTPSIKIRWDNVVIAGQLVWKHHILYPSHKHHMNVIESHIMGNSVVCSTAYSDWQQRKHHRSALLALCEGHPPVNGGFPSQRASNDWWIPLTKGQ